MTEVNDKNEAPQSAGIHPPTIDPMVKRIIMIGFEGIYLSYHGESRGGENRTPIKGFGDLYSTIELHPQVFRVCTYPESNGDLRLRKPLLYPIKL